MKYTIIQSDKNIQQDLNVPSSVVVSSDRQRHGNTNKGKKTKLRHLFEVLCMQAIIFITISSFLGCKKLIEVDLPIDKNTAETVYGSTPTAVSAINGIYNQIATTEPFVGLRGISIRSGLMADELTAIIPEIDKEYLNSYDGQSGWSFWSDSYIKVIYAINSALLNIGNSKSLPDMSKKILSGEVKFLRAWMYFYLLNFYGDVPLVLTTDFKANSTISRSPVNVVYDQIEKDLLEAQKDLPETFVDKDLYTITEERIRPNKIAASALLARVYLYRQKWANAELEASKVIGNSNYELLADVDKVFLKNSREAIWQLQPNPLDPDGNNAPDGRWLIDPYTGSPFYFLSPFLLEKFENFDLRRSHWIATNQSGLIIQNKYKEKWGIMDQKEYTMALRLAEQFLIRAEARAHLNKLTGPNSAEADLNDIRHRAGLPNTSAKSQDAMLKAIAQERQFELFLEWGHRWLDLKRTGEINNVMSKITPLKGGIWSPFKALLPIPYDEFKFNTALRGYQNPGYQEQP